jgi:gluconolactonase
MAARPEIETFDERLESVLDPAAELELLADGFDFVEGPVWDGPGNYLLFSDVSGDVVRRWDATGGAREWRRPSGKASGLTRDNAGRLIACEHVTSSVTRTAQDGAVTRLATDWQGRELNSPNDVCVARSGAIYFTDPADGRTSERWGLVRERQLDFQGVYLRRPDGEVVLLSDGLAFPNGVCLSPDERTLYVNDTSAMHVLAFDVGADGTAGSARVFLEQPGTGELWDGVPDGMKCDERGNLWATGPFGVWIADPAGTVLGRVRIPVFASNLAWGGPDWGDLYVTATDRLYRLHTRTRGARTPHVVHGELQRLADSLRAEVDAGRVTIRLDDEPGIEFPVKAEALAYGLGAIAADRLEGVRASETFRWVAREGRALVQDDIARSAVVPAPALTERYGAVAQILAPVVRDGATVGLVSVHEGRGPRRWTPNEVAAAERVASEVALAP